MSTSTYNRERRNRRRQLVAVVVVASLLVAGIIALASSSNDPIAKQLVPPVSTADRASDTNSEPTAPLADSSAAIDGAPGKKSTATGDHEDPIVAPPSTAAADSGDVTGTAARFARIMINWPTDRIEAEKLNKQLIRLASGTLASDLAANQGEISTAQVSSEGEILDLKLLEQQDNYAEVLVVAKQSNIDETTHEPLDPTYLNYLVRLDRTDAGTWAVTSWEPQI